MNRSIVLTGPMGSGKSSVAHLLAAQLGLQVVDLDACIVEQAGKTVNQIFAEYGEAGFRERESAELARLVGRTDMVLATGGGVITRPENRRLLPLIGLVVNLTASVDELAHRLATADDRPLLQGEESLAARISRLMLEREAWYAEADIRIDTTGKTLEDVANSILASYRGAVGVL